MYWIYFLCSGFLSNLHLPWEKELPWNFSLHVLNILFTFRIFEQLVLAQKKRVCPEIFHCEYIFFIIQNFWATCAGPEKQSLPYNFSLYWNIFYHSEFLSNLRLPWKTAFALKIFTVLNILFTFRIFEQLALALKNSVPWIHCIEFTFFIIQDFWATCTCLEKQSLSCKFSLYWKYFLSFRIFEQL